MYNRDELFQKFGPKLFEAMCLILLKEHNKLRDALQMPAISVDEMLQILSNQLDQTPNYSWTKTEPQL
jgi:hypothetical protein